MNSHAMKQLAFICVILAYLSMGFATGCGDSGSDEAALREYFENIEAAVHDQRASLDELGDPDVNEDLVLDEREKTVVLELFATQRRTLETLLEALNEAVPPPEVAEAHSAVVSSVMGAIGFWQSLTPDLETIDSIESLEAFGTQFVESAEGMAVFERQMSACTALQTIATQHDIVIDLMCTQDG